METKTEYGIIFDNQSGVDSDNDFVEFWAFIDSRRVSLGIGMLTRPSSYNERFEHALGNLRAIVEMKRKYKYMSCK